MNVGDTNFGLRSIICEVDFISKLGELAEVRNVSKLVNLLVHVVVRISSALGRL